MTAPIINAMTGLPLSDGYMQRTAESAEGFPAITMLANRDKYGHATPFTGSLWERLSEGKRDRDLYIFHGVQRAALIAGVARLNRTNPL
jgi:hypothetical protein